MSDAIYSYTKNRLSGSLERCGWSDSVGTLFSRNIMSEIYKSIDAIKDTTYDIDDFLKKIEAELNDR